MATKKTAGQPTAPSPSPSPSPSSSPSSSAASRKPRSVPPSLIESWGLRPFGLAARQTATAVFGAEDVPPSKTGWSSLALLSPRLAVPLWLGRCPVPRKVVLTNLFNHTQTAEHLGWSTLRTQVRDFRGHKQTYDSHNGTDLCIPRGTLVVAPADGQVGRVFREFNRGGLKIAIDHGDGLMTCCVHLARALVDEGDLVLAGQAIAVSGYSGLDGFSTFPWGIPHVHFNTWLNTTPVDPFAVAEELALWRSGQPRPIPSLGRDNSSEGSSEKTHPKSGEKPRKSTQEFHPSTYDEVAVDALIDTCTTSSVRARLRAIGPLWQRAAHVICERNYYPTRFAARVPSGQPGDRGVYAARHSRAEMLYLPFLATAFDGVVFRDAL